MAEETFQYTPDEQRNIDLVKKYMEIAYDPKRASAGEVAELCARDNRFVAPTTFPEVSTLEEYAENHGRMMKQITDLRFSSFDVLFAKGNRVCIRYTAQGSHNGEPHGNIPPSGRKACWTASAIFKIENGKIKEFIKDWNKLSMWEQLGWPLEECLSQGAPERMQPPVAEKVREMPETSVH